VSYIQALQGPLGHIPLVPTGGVTVANAPDFLAAGAIAVGLSGSLFPAAAIRSGQWEAITTQARQLVQTIRSAP
jgi:2-dehydro-3-deoxyphosphogluconate aldolase/(4S)-4-hydroxy-2-oxoglutarate aldolase